jgi:murein DD-endopeptidase MepM/ murein hydrolase activator NlpD
VYPPLSEKVPVPINDMPGAFGVKRKHHTHEGVDLYCEHGDPVFAMEDGVIVWTGWFTGEYTGTPWWNNTAAIAVQHSFGVLFYGEIVRRAHMEVGNTVSEGEHLGFVSRVLKNDKGTPTSMLHLELYDKLPEILPPPLWIDDKPKGLLDPTMYLLFI